MVPLEAAQVGRRSLNGRERTARSVGSGAFARIAAHLRSGSLDRSLIAGADPSASAALAARARTLSSRRTRTHLAEGLERALAAVNRPQRRWSVAPRRGPLPANAAAVRDLVDLLRGDTPLYAPGIAILNQLLTDGTGPAYTGPPHGVAPVLHEARAAMLG